MELDETDRQLLKLLQEDGRRSFRELAAAIGVSTPTVSARVAALEEAGLIRGYYADLNADLLGQQSLVLLITAKPADLAPLCERLQKLDGVRQVFRLSNQRALLVAAFYDASSQQRFIEGLAAYPEIQHCEAGNVLRTYREDPRAVLSEASALVLRCFYCGKEIRDAGIRLKLDDGRTHYLCCETCASAYQEKYERLKAAAKSPPAREPETRHSH